MAEGEQKREQSTPVGKVSSSWGLKRSLKHLSVSAAGSSPSHAQLSRD
jgi:hypothetical protein